MENLKFSVAMCVYGGDNAIHFDKALESVFCQTLCPDEVVLIVDGPIPDDIELVIEKYCKYKNLNVYRLPKNMGHGYARQESLKHCTNELVAIADADDINTADRFELQVQAFNQNPDLSVVSSYCFHFSESIEKIINEEKIPISDEEIKKGMKTRCCICNAAVMFKRQEVLAVGGYKDWYYAEDYYLWLRLMLSGATFANIPKSLLYVRTNDGQIRRRGGFKYFNSLRKLYGFMLKKHIIGFGTYLFNVGSRFVIQILMPNRLRAWIRKKVL